MLNPEILVFRSGSLFKPRTGDAAIDSSNDSINLRIIDTNVYMAIQITLETAEALVKNVRSCLDKTLDWIEESWIHHKQVNSAYSFYLSYL